MSRIESLLEQMSLAEKLGQLTMSSADQAVTGPTMAKALLDDVRSGAVGSVLNLFGSERVRTMQRRAVEESRLHIPLFFGLDVIHGFRTSSRSVSQRRLHSTRSSGSRPPARRRARRRVKVST